MADVLTLDYRSGGSPECLLGEAFDRNKSQVAIEAARRVLVSRQEDASVRLLDGRPFTLHHGTNGFGDEFLTLYAAVSAETYAELERDDAQARSQLRTAAAGLRAALGDAVGADDGEVRFVQIGRATNVVRGVMGDYTYEERFDGGGFASVHRARSATGTDCVLKMPLTHDPESLGRLRREIEEQRQIVHPAVMPVLDHDPAYRWFVMPVAEENLAACFADKRLSEATLLAALRSAAAGLEAAHARGLVHRDVSPRNILRIGEQWVVM